MFYRSMFSEKHRKHVLKTKRLYSAFLELIIFIIENIQK